MSQVRFPLLRRAPEGAVDWPPCTARVRRLAVPACSVSLVVVRAGTWRSGLRRAAGFEPFARSAVVLTRLSERGHRDYAWEADVAGVGLWVDRKDSCRVEQVVAPAEFILRYVKPARWSFQERAYSAWRADAPEK